MRARFITLFLQPLQAFVGVLIGLYTTVWGLWVISPWWDTFDHGDHYNFLESLLPEFIWGLIATAVGVMIIRSCWTLNVRVIKYTALVGFYFWGAVASSYIYSDWQALAWIPAAFFSIIEGYAYLNLKIREERGWIDTEAAGRI